MSGTLSTTEYVPGSAGGSASDSGTTIVSGGFQYVGDSYGTGTATNTTISAGGFQFVGESGGVGTATSTIIAASGFQIVGSASGTGTATSTTIQSGGVQYVGIDDGTGTAISTTIDDATQIVGGAAGTGTAFETNIASGGFQYVGYESGGFGTAEFTTISGGVQFVGANSGYGFVESTTIGVGLQVVGSAQGTGYAISTTINNHGSQIVGVSGGSGFAEFTTIGSGGSQYVGESSGIGTAISTTILSGGIQYVGDYSGTGMATSTTLDAGGTQYVFSGGSATDTTIYSGGLQYLDGIGGAAEANSTTLSGGAQYVGDSGGVGTATSTTIDSGGAQYVGVSSGGIGTAIATTINGGVEYVGYLGGSGYDSGATIDAGMQIVGGFGVGTATSATISGGEQFVYSGGTASGATIDSGYQFVEDGGSAVDTTINQAGPGGQTGQYVGFGNGYLATTGTATNTTIAGGLQFVGDGYYATGTVTSTTIERFGGQIVGFSGATGSAISTTIESGGIQYVGLSGGVGSASDTIIQAGGTQEVGDGSGAIGFAISTAISGGTQYVSAGGTATDTTIYSDGLAEIQSGGIVDAAVIDGGVLQLDAGATVGADGIDFGVASGAFGGKLDLSGEGSSYTLTEEISGFTGEGDTAALSDVIDVAGNGATDQIVWTQNGASGTLQVETASNVVLDTFTLEGSYSQDQFVLTEVSATIDQITYNANAPCYVAGTLIATETGEIPIEDLCVGDIVVTASGERRPIVWIGWRDVDCTRHPEPETVWPVRIVAGAIRPGAPARDLVVSPGHSLFLEDVLVPAIHLVNGTTVFQERAASVRYWHVELDQHDLLLAEGLAAESYLDCRNRSAFANGGSVASLHPDFSPQGEWPADAHWAEENACAPRHLDGPVVQGIRRSLARRAAELGARAIRDPGVQVMADGEALTPVSVRDGSFAFEAPEDAKSLRLCSRSAVLAQLVEAENSDTRRLGVRVRKIVIDEQNIALDAPELADGWHELESHEADQWRWSNGDAELPIGRHLTIWLQPLPVAYPLPGLSPSHRARPAKESFAEVA